MRQHILNAFDRQIVVQESVIGKLQDQNVLFGAESGWEILGFDLGRAVLVRHVRNLKLNGKRYHKV
jgi:hypothetical protein